MSSTQQKALFLPAKHAEFTVGATKIPTPGPGQLLIKIQAIGLNPVDWKIQKFAFAVETYPAIIGLDFAGIVETVGEGVTSFQKGDRVTSSGKWENDFGAFQQFALAAAEFTAKIPASFSFDQAASLPIGISTAAVGLYQKTVFGAGLTGPWEQGGKGKYEGKPFVVFGGSGAVGSYVIQYAKLSGFSPIITTASPHNAKYLQSLGATYVIDRNLDGSRLSEEIKKVTSEPVEVVYDAVGDAATQRVAIGVLVPGGVLVSVAQSTLGDVGEGKTFKSTFASPFHPLNNEVGAGYFGSLTSYLNEGSIQPNRVEVIQGGLNGIVDGLNRLKEGKVSGVKLIVQPQNTA